VQVDSIKPVLKAPGSKHLKAKYDQLLSTFAFKSTCAATTRLASGLEQVVAEVGKAGPLPPGVTHVTLSVGACNAEDEVGQCMLTVPKTVLIAPAILALETIKS
jgi:hypothetical protein